MYPSQPYVKQLRRIAKEATALSPQEAEGRLREAFGRGLSGIPVELAEELFDFYLDRITADGSEAVYPDLVDSFMHTAAVIDLFGRSYDDEADPLAADEWQFLAETVPDFAPDMDMQTLQYVMGHLVQRKMI